MAHLHWTLPPVAGGVETYLADFSRLLAARGHPVTLFTGKGKLDWPQVTTVQSDLLDLDRYETPLTSAETERLAGQLAEFLGEEFTQRGIRVVHGHNLHHFTPVPALALRRLERELGLLVHHTYHSLWDTELTIARLCRDWPGQHVFSRYVRRACAAELSLRTVLTYPGIAQDRYRWVAPPRRPDEYVVLLPARLSPHKGAETAVEMLDTLRGEGLPVRLVLTTPTHTVDWENVEDDYRRQVEATIARYGLEDHVEFRSAVYDEMPELYAGATVVIYPSTYPEPLGLAPLEAAAVGRPAVVTRAGGLPETVRHGRTGYIVPPGDLAALTGRVRALLTRPRRVRRMGRAARALIHHRFALEDHADRMIRHYRSTGM